MPMNRGREWRTGENASFKNVPYNTPLGRAGLNYNMSPAGHLPSENPNLRGIRDTADAILESNGIEVGDQKFGPIPAGTPLVGTPSMGTFVLTACTVTAVLVFIGVLFSKPRR